MRPRQASMSCDIIRLLSRWWGGSDVHSASESIPSAPADQDRGRGCAQRQQYWLFLHHRCPKGIVRNSNLPSPEPATNCVLLGRKHASLTGLFLPGRIVQCKGNGVRFATRAHHAGPPPLACSPLPRQPVTLTLTSLKAVVVAAPPFILPLLFLPSLQ
jgi:hypothetical protein